MEDLSKKIKVTTLDDGEEYVFISYRSKDRKTMEKIVYQLQSEYGLRVYYDKNFKINNPNWTKQFQENLDSKKCRAIIIFISDGYYTSYATLMELMHSQCGTAKVDGQRMSVIPITIKDNDVFEEDDENTGLGVSQFPPGYPYKENLHWKNELKVFIRDFMKVKKYVVDEIDDYAGETLDSYIEKEPNKWQPCDYKNPILKKKDCRNMIKVLIHEANINDNEYKESDDFIKDFAENIKQTRGVGEGVFGAPTKKSVNAATEPSPEKMSKPVESPAKLQKQEPVKAQKPESASPTPATEEKATKFVQLDPVTEENQKEDPVKNSKPSVESEQSENKKTKYEPGTWEYSITYGEIDATYTQCVDENGKDYKYILHAGSRIKKESVPSAPKEVITKRKELEDEDKLIDAVVKAEVEFKSSSAFAKFCVGGSISGPEFIKKAKLIGKTNEVKAEVPASDQQLSRQEQKDVSDAAQKEVAVQNTEPTVESGQSEDKKTKYDPGIWDYKFISGEINVTFTQYVDENGKDYKYILHSGSRISKTAAASIPSAAKKRRQKLADEGKIIDAYVNVDVEFASASALGCFCRGGSESGTRFIKASKWID